MSSRRPPLPELWGVAEIVAEIGVTKMTVQRWRARRDFPKPALELRMGPVWIADDVRAWAESVPRDRRGRVA